MSVESLNSEEIVRDKSYSPRDLGPRGAHINKGLYMLKNFRLSLFLARVVRRAGMTLFGNGRGLQIRGRLSA